MVFAEFYELLTQNKWVINELVQIFYDYLIKTLESKCRVYILTYIRD